MLKSGWLHCEQEDIYQLALCAIPPLFFSFSAILPPTAKASALISSTHLASKDLDPTQGRGDNNPLAWPPPILSLLSVCLRAMRRTNWTAWPITNTLNSFLPPVCQPVCDCVCELWLRFFMERSSHVRAAVCSWGQQTDEVTDTSVTTKLL